jgi:hypothetical protein
MYEVTVERTVRNRNTYKVLMRNRSGKHHLIKHRIDGMILDVSLRNVCVLPVGYENVNWI